MERYDVIVIGGGPAGLLAAGSAAEQGAKVLVLEKMRRIGRKLLITGKGRCNITNSAPISEFVKHVFPNGRYLKPVFSQFFNSEIIELLEANGLKSILERGGRYFPETDKSIDVLNALLKWLEPLNVTIECNQKVDKILTEDGSIKGLIVNENTINTSRIIIATGGKSYPATGSTGDGYKLAKQCGHTIEAPIPALVPLETEGRMAQELQGLNLRNVQATVWIDNKKQGDAFGEMIFTHFGLSGPIILTLSRLAVAALREDKQVSMTIDLKPALDDHKLDQRLLRDLNENGKKQIVNIFKLWLPASMIPVFLSELNIDPDKPGHQISGQERKNIRVMMKNLSFKIKTHRPYEEAIITAGGVKTSEIAAKTMESKFIKGLYFAGEVIDLDAETGGYNLQIAYSTGWVAGRHAALG